MGMDNGYELRKSSEKGDGVFSTRPFKEGDLVMVGIVSEVLGANCLHASQIGEGEFVLHAGLVNKVNHSCAPNCGIRVNEAGGHDYVAMKDIKSNEEITFDYAMQNYDIEYFPGTCLCGSVGCRGKITGWKDLPIEKRKQYEGFVAPYLFELDARLSSGE